MKKETVKYYIDADKEVKFSNFYADLKDGKCVVFSLVDLTCEVKKIKKLKNLNLVEISLESYKTLLDKFSMLRSLEEESNSVSGDRNTQPTSPSVELDVIDEEEDKEEEDKEINFSAKTKLRVLAHSESYVGYSQRDEEEVGLFIAQTMRSGDPMIISDLDGKFKYVIGHEILKNSIIEISSL